jgi:hypothetical protein
MIKNEMTSAVENLKSEFTKTTDFLCEEQRDIKQELHATVNKISLLETDKAKLQSEISDMQRRLVTLEKSSRSRNIEIQCVPDRRNENIVAIFKNICDVIGVKVDDHSVYAVRRVAKLNPNSSRPRNIIATFPSERHRDDILSAFKRYNKQHPADPLNSASIGVPCDISTKTNIYLVEHLSPECKELYSTTRRWAKDCQYKFVWVKYGKIYLRKDDNSPALHVKDLATLTKLKSST